MNTLVSPTHSEKLPAGRLPPLRLNGAPVAGVLPVSAAASCPGVVAHMVSEQVMAAHAKSKAAANLLRLGFMNFSFGFWVFGFYIPAASPLWQPHKCVSIG